MCENYFDNIKNQMRTLYKRASLLKLQSEYYKKRAYYYKMYAQELSEILISLNFVERNRTIWTLNRTSTFWEVEVPTYTEQQFKNNFRMKRDTFEKLVQDLKCLEKSDTNYRNAISLSKRVAISIYFLASSAENRTVANLFGVGRTTVGELVLNFCHAVCKNLQADLINFYPPTASQVSENISEFEKRWGFPQTVAAVDGSHIEIRPPIDQAVDYFNYKGWYSIVLMAAVDYKYRFLYINVGSPGRNNDSYIFEKSKLKNQHENNSIFYENRKIIKDTSVPALLVGDGAFRLCKFLMKPYQGTELTEAEKEFNKQLSRARRVVENAFGHLKARFRTIGKGIDADITNTVIIIKACCVLHNYLILKNDEISNEWVTEERNSNGNANRHQPENVTTRGNTDEDGNKIRNAIKEYLYEKRDRTFEDNDGINNGESIISGVPVLPELPVGDDNGDDINSISSLCAEYEDARNELNN